MGGYGSVGRGFLMAGVVLLTLTAAPSAHETKIAGKLRVTLGWADEPAFTGLRNAIVVSLADAAGPLKDPGAALSVEVSFGDERITLALEPSPGATHEFRAAIVPTRAGTYTFHVTGKVRGQAVDVTSTCSEATFHCVGESSQIQFPTKEPSAGQLADRLGRALPRADDAAERATRATRVAGAAFMIAAVSLVTAISILVRSRSRP